MTLVIRFLEEHTGEEAFTLESGILNAARLRSCGTFRHKPGGASMASGVGERVVGGDC